MMIKKRLAAAMFAVVMAAAFYVPARAATARQNYKFYCAQCHGLEGRGDGPNAVESMPVDPRDHASAYEMSKISDEDIIAAITGGGDATSKSTLMPPFGKTLTKAEIRDLKNLIRKLCNCSAR